MNLKSIKMAAAVLALTTSSFPNAAFIYDFVCDATCEGNNSWVGLFNIRENDNSVISVAGIAGIMFGTTSIAGATWDL